MQAAHIKLGESYAVKRRGAILPIRITEQHTVKKAAPHNKLNTKNYFSGYRLDLPNRGGGQPRVDEIESSDVLMLLAEHTVLMQEKRDREAAAQREKEAAEQERWEVIELLAELTGMPAPERGKRSYETRRLSPFGDVGTGIEIAQIALPVVTAILLKARS